MKDHHLPFYWLGRLALFIVAAVAVALGIWLGRRAPPDQAVPAARTAPETLAREIAALDRVYAADAPRAGAGAAYYRDRRAALLDQLVDAQAVEDRGTTT